MWTTIYKTFQYWARTLQQLCAKKPAWNVILLANNALSVASKKFFTHWLRLYYNIMERMNCLLLCQTKSCWRRSLALISGCCRNFSQSTLNCCFTKMINRLDKTKLCFLKSNTKKLSPALTQISNILLTSGNKSTLEILLLQRDLVGLHDKQTGAIKVLHRDTFHDVRT